MSWADKELKKHKLRKQIDTAMNSPEYKKRQQEHDLRVFMVYVMVSVDYLFREEKYEQKQVENFLDFVKKQMGYVADDDEYFRLLNQELKKDVGVNVMEYMGFWEEN